MFLGVDIGGTKTLMACFSAVGQPTSTKKFKTNQDYKQFLVDFEANFKSLTQSDLQSAVVGIPGRLDRELGRALGYGNLKWPEVPIEADIQAIVGCPVTIENDSKLAGLSEAKLILNEFKRVMYVTIGTGISDAVIMNGVIDKAMEDSEGGQMWLDYGGRLIQWEDLASGKAIVSRYGKRAEEITDTETWKQIAHFISLGMVNLINVVQPDAVVIGGGIGEYFERFAGPLIQELKRYATPLTPTPPILKAKRPEEAVIYGCYDLASQKYASIHK